MILYVAVEPEYFVGSAGLNVAVMVVVPYFLALIVTVPVVGSTVATLSPDAAYVIVPATPSATVAVFHGPGKTPEDNLREVCASVGLAFGKSDVGAVKRERCSDVVVFVYDNV